MSITAVQAKRLQNHNFQHNTSINVEAHAVPIMCSVAHAKCTVTLVSGALEPCTSGSDLQDPEQVSWELFPKIKDFQIQQVLQKRFSSTSGKLYSTSWFHIVTEWRCRRIFADRHVCRFSSMLCWRVLGRHRVSICLAREHSFTGSSRQSSIEYSWSPASPLLILHRTAPVSLKWTGLSSLNSQ